VKIAFDENVPIQMVRVFKALGQEKRFSRSGIEFVSATDYTPRPSDPDYEKNNDVPWLNRFAKGGGTVVVSGNVRMLEQPHELAALGQFTVFMFERRWNQWDFHRKTSLLLFNWPLVLAKLKKAEVGEVWCIPNHFKQDGELRDVSPGSVQIKKSNPRRSARKSVMKSPPVGAAYSSGRRHEPRRPQDDRQGSFDLSGGRQHAPGSSDDGQE
jgi:hypothetical protein